MIAAAKSVRRLVLDISPLMAAYLLFQAALGLFLDFVWLRYPFGNPMLLPGVLLALNGSMIASKVPVWRMLPVSAREIDRARWWHSVGAPGLVLALMLAVSVLILTAMGSPCELARYRPWPGAVSSPVASPWPWCGWPCRWRGANGAAGAPWRCFPCY